MVINMDFTSAAVQAIQQRLGNESFFLKLVFDSEGCGCALSGVPVLWAVDDKQEHDVELNGAPFQMIIASNHVVFFEEHLKVDFHETKRTFSLKSNSQIYNAMMSVVDRRGQMQ